MKSNLVSFRFNWEDLDNLKYIQYYYGERNLSKTDVLRMLLREARKELESEVDALRQPHERDYGDSFDSCLSDFVDQTYAIIDELPFPGMDSGAINTEPPEGHRRPESDDCDK